MWVVVLGVVWGCGGMNRSERDGRLETTRAVGADWSKGYECGLKHAENIRGAAWWLLVCAFVVGVAFGVSL